MNVYFLVSSILCALLALMHYFKGTPAIMGPILRTPELTARVKLLAHCCWHLVTVTAAVMAASLAWAAIHPDSTVLAVMALIQMLGFSAVGFYLISRSQFSLLQVPQGIAFLLAASVTGAGLLWG